MVSMAIIGSLYYAFNLLYNRSLVGNRDEQAWLDTIQAQFSVKKLIIVRNAQHMPDTKGTQRLSNRRLLSRGVQPED
jgi:hypothetical protein